MELTHILHGAAVAIGVMADRIQQTAQTSNLTPSQQDRVDLITVTLADMVQELTELAEKMRLG